MRLLVLGATGATGKMVVDQAVDAGHHVRALVRSPAKLTAPSPNLEIVTGQVTDLSELTHALRSTDAVIVTLGAAKGTVITDATRALLVGASEHGVKRVVMLSSFAMLRDQLSVPAKLMTATVMGPMMKDKSAAEQLLRDSALDYTIVYATRLGTGPAAAAVRVVSDRAQLTLANGISRTDVAAWLLDAAVNGGYSRASVAITS